MWPQVMRPMAIILGEQWQVTHQTPRCTKFRLRPAQCAAHLFLRVVYGRVSRVKVWLGNSRLCALWDLGPGLHPIGTRSLLDVQHQDLLITVWGDGAPTCAGPAWGSFQDLAVPAPLSRLGHRNQYLVPLRKWAVANPEEGCIDLARGPFLGGVGGDFILYCQDRGFE